LKKIIFVNGRQQGAGQPPHRRRHSRPQRRRRQQRALRRQFARPALRRDLHRPPASQRGQRLPELVRQLMLQEKLTLNRTGGRGLLG